jgi:3'-phosphoadenosine 5'-phosphosulfate (PAPS) 3'-phosphatase
MNHTPARIIIGAALARPLYSSTRSGTAAFKMRSSRHTIPWIRQRGGGGGGGIPSLPLEDSSTGMSATGTSDDDDSSSSTSSTLKQEEPDWEEDYNELPLDFPRRRDALVALAAVRKACAVTQRLQPIHSPNVSFTGENNNNQQETNNNSNNNNSNNNNNTSSSSSSTIATVTKLDLSPVTVADFAAQALVLNHLYQTFGGGLLTEDSFIAEESSAALENDAHLAELIWNATRHELKSIEQVKQSIELGKEYLSWTTSTTTTTTASSVSSTTDQQQEKEAKEEGLPRGEEVTTNTTTTSSSSTSQRQRPRPKRVWCLDPIDGTKGFLRGKRPGGQYAVALALLEVRELEMRAHV